MKPCIPLGLALVVSACAGSDDTPQPMMCPVPDFGTTDSYTLTRDVVYDRIGETDLLADLYVPDGPGPHPGLVMIHGGGWLMGDRELMRRASEHYAERGFAVLNIEYRLIDGSGIKIPDQVRDSVCAVRWFRAHASEYDLHPDCVGALGESAGGHLSAMVGLTWDRSAFQEGCADAGDTSAKVAFAMPYYGVYDAEDFIATYGPTFVSTFFATGQDPLDYSPTRLALLHPEIDYFLPVGTADNLVPPPQTYDFYAALDRAGHPTRMVVVEGGGHGFVAIGFDGADNAVVQPQAEAWLAETLGRPRSD